MEILGVFPLKGYRQFTFARVKGCCLCEGWHGDDDGTRFVQEFVAVVTDPSPTRSENLVVMHICDRCGFARLNWPATIVLPIDNFQPGTGARYVLRPEA